MKKEPVAWCKFQDGIIEELLTDLEMKDWVDDTSWTPLYLAEPKPLNDEEIESGFRISENASDAGSFWAGVRYAEEMQNNGGGE